MEQKLYEKIGRQEVIIEALKQQNLEVSSLVAKFISGEEKPEDWHITPQGQLKRKASEPVTKAPRKPSAKKP